MRCEERGAAHGSDPEQAERQRRSPAKPRPMRVAAKRSADGGAGSTRVARGCDPVADRARRSPRLIARLSGRIPKMGTRVALCQGTGTAERVQMRRLRVAVLVRSTSGGAPLAGSGEKTFLFQSHCRKKTRDIRVILDASNRRSIAAAR